MKIFQLQNDRKFKFPQDRGNVRSNIEICVLHNETRDEHYETKY